MSNGKVKQQNTEQAPQLLQILQSEQFQKSLNDTTQARQDSDPTKFTLLENISDDAKSDWFTYYRNYDEVLQMNDIESHARLLELVFCQEKSKTRIEYDLNRTKKHIQKIETIFFAHTKDHMRNMSAFKRSQLLALVHAVRNDNGSITTGKDVMKMFGGR